jgi:hypothetical protein
MFSSFQILHKEVNCSKENELNCVLWMVSSWFNYRKEYFSSFSSDEQGKTIRQTIHIYSHATFKVETAR